jgi:hypothetical protein
MKFVRVIFNQIFNNWCVEINVELSLEVPVNWARIELEISIDPLKNQGKNWKFIWKKFCFRASEDSSKNEIKKRCSLIFSIFFFFVFRQKLLILIPMKKAIRIYQFTNKQSLNWKEKVLSIISVNRFFFVGFYRWKFQIMKTILSSTSFIES